MDSIIIISRQQGGLIVKDQTVIIVGHFSPWQGSHSLSWNIKNWLPSGMASYPRRMESSATLLQIPTKFIHIFSYTSEETCTEDLVQICEGNRPLGKPRKRRNINRDLKRSGAERCKTGQFSLKIVQMASSCENCHQTLGSEKCGSISRRAEELLRTDSAARS